MATIVPRHDGSSADSLPSLFDGQQLPQSEFHRIYEDYPKYPKFELIDGVVYMAAAQLRPHSRYEALLSAILVAYDASTPGTEALHNASTILDEKNEPQPDLQLRILAEFGGQTVVTPNQYISGPPELVIEVSYSSLNLDLRKKATIYQQQGVKEYLVVDAQAEKFHWFVWPEGERAIDPDGILRSAAFPGLWIDSQALFNENLKDMQATLQLGLQQSEHAAFVAKLKSQSPQ